MRAYAIVVTTPEDAWIEDVLTDVTYRQVLNAVERLRHQAKRDGLPWVVRGFRHDTAQRGDHALPISDGAA